MDLSKIITIAGKSGLYKVVSQARSGLVAESLTDGRKVPVFATDRSSTLEDISIFTTGGDVPLKDVLWQVYQKYDGKPGIDPKASPESLKQAFEEILPDFDKDRVYISDIKKVFSWYLMLLEKDLVTEPEAETEDNEAQKDGETQSDDETAEPKPTAKKKKPATGTKHAEAQKASAKSATRSASGKPSKGRTKK